MNDNFESLNLNEDLLKGIYLHGFVQPSKIQIKGIKSINTGSDCIIQSQSGTGKTATYLLGVLNRLDQTLNNCQGIIITPTRELANQVYDVSINLSKYINFKITKCIGGTNFIQNKNDLKNSHLIIGTLGRLYHIIFELKYNIFNLKFIVLDEADDLLNNGINPKLNDILEKLPTGIQVILISATMSLDVFNLSKKYMHDPIKILLKNNEIMVELISQFYLDVEIEDQKFDTLLDLYNLVSTSQAIIFCNTIKKVEWLEQKLIQNNFPITVMHSNMTANERVDVLKDFRDGKTRILLTTDLLSRGIDIPQVNMVINYDLPNNKETYVHRIGRCGRFNKKGIAISMVKTTDASDIKTLSKFKNFYNIDIKEMPESIDKYL
uniref:Helicase n=1 Tax=viral metagenome TaxID=1070528 RepID=A0A6C0EI49_9ZZZZ